MDSWDESWAYAPNLFCQRGAFVLRPNYHGSSNYGLKWLESNSRGKYNDLETVDIEKGVDHLIARGLVDPERLGVGGWSNGAILTSALTVKTTRFKAAYTGAGTVEYISDWANCDFGDAFDRFYLGKTPLEDLQLYLDKSPFFRFDKVRTPTLIMFGSEDRTVPTEQGWVHYRGLQQLAKTDVRFLLFPGEKHSLKKPSHQRRKLAEELAWFDRHLFKTYKEENESFKAASPLAWALQRKQAKRVEGRFGVLEKGVLAPETVSYAGLLLGRFEVTRAQFAQFDGKYKVEPGQDNYPAGGITFEQARDYCQWLSKKTGRTYRLPSEEEAGDLYDKSESGENTLDYWAGYTVNPDDAAQLQEKIKELGGTAPLLREVGSFRGDGDKDMVFDLGGSLAEWVLDKNGKGSLRGGSADRPANAQQRQSLAAPAYRGFRVVLEAEKEK
jgi:dienelactone hydrolase